MGEPRSSYRGERSFPLILQNVHRYFLYIALGFIVMLSYDAWKALWFSNPTTGSAEFGVGVGSIVLLANVTLLACYAFGCHSLRHLVGGRKDVLSGSSTLGKTYDCVSCLNRQHMRWAWLSLFSVGFSDLYIRPLLHGRMDGLENSVVTEYQPIEHDVLVIGAGGAGLRAAIEARAHGASVGLVCKSLLGKAHTVMAEGGIAAALAMSMTATTGRSTSPTRCAVVSTSTTGGWRSCTLKKLPPGYVNSKHGERFSTARPTGASCSATSVATPTLGSPT